MISLHGSQDYKRRYPRIDLTLPADLRIHFPNQALEQLSVNISSLNYGGLTFISPANLKVGSTVEMTLFNFIDHIPFSAEITWTKKLPDEPTPSFKSGLKFAQISDENLVKIHNIVNSYLFNPNSPS